MKKNKMLIKCMFLNKVNKMSRKHFISKGKKFLNILAFKNMLIPFPNPFSSSNILEIFLPCCVSGQTSHPFNVFVTHGSFETFNPDSPGLKYTYC